MNKQEKKYNYFYKITNLVNGKYYYGIHSTYKNIKEDYYFGSGSALQKAIKKYGKENFIKEIIADYQTRKEASDHEARIVTFELVKLRECYNCKTGGDNEFTMSEESRQMLKKSHTGKVLSIEHKRRISESNKGKPKSDEARKKISSAKSGTSNPMYGKTGTSCPNFGKIHSDEARQLMSISKSGKNNPMYGKAGHNLGRKFSEEIKERMRDKPSCKSCKILGVVYISISDAARQLGIDMSTLKYRLKSKNAKFSEWRVLLNDKSAN